MTVGAVGTAWALEPAEVAAELATDLERGLAGDDAVRRLAEIGPNVLVEAEQPGPGRIVARQLTNTMTVVRRAAAPSGFV